MFAYLFYFDVTTCKTNTRRFSFTRLTTPPVFTPGASSCLLLVASGTLSVRMPLAPLHPRKKARRWHRWIPYWYRIRSLRAVIESNDSQYRSTLQSASSDDERQAIHAEWNMNSAPDEEYLDKLITERWQAKARRWWVILPTPDHTKLSKGTDPNWERTTNLRYVILTGDGRANAARALWQRKIEIAALIFGVASAVQAVYSVLSYHWPSVPPPPR
jgi:hypothetical protein